MTAWLEEYVIYKAWVPHPKSPSTKFNAYGSCGSGDITFL